HQATVRWITTCSDSLWFLCASLNRPFGAQRPNNAPRLPHLAVGDRFQLLLQLRAIVLATVGLERAPRFVAGLDFPVKLFENRLRGVAETFEPVERAALGRGGAVGVHPIH